MYEVDHAVKCISYYASHTKAGNHCSICQLYRVPKYYYYLWMWNNKYLHMSLLKTKQNKKL